MLNRDSQLMTECAGPRRPFAARCCCLRAFLRCIVHHRPTFARANNPTLLSLLSPSKTKTPTRQQTKTRWVLHVLNLTHAADTVIGDAMLRGVSGGERRRVTSGEMLVSAASVLLMDEISTGEAILSCVGVVVCMQAPSCARRAPTLVCVCSCAAARASFHPNAR